MRHRQFRVGKELLGQEQPGSLRELDRGSADDLAHKPPQLPRTEPETRGQILHVQAAIQVALLNPGHDPGDRGRSRLVRGYSWGKLRTAAEARTIARALRGGGAHVERTALSRSFLRGANGPAVDPCGRNPHEEKSVKTPVAPENRLVTSVFVQHSG